MMPEDRAQEIEECESRGARWQGTLIVMFVLRVAILDVMFTPIDVIGCAIFSGCLFYLYVKKRRLTNLITGGLFKYTRHPMYLGAFLMDTCVWWLNFDEFAFWISALAFWVSLLAAGYWQEEETLARFGEEAEAYYAKTPRFLLFF